MKPNRTIRIGQLMRKELAELLQTPKLGLHSFFITVTEVRLTGDLKHATAWVSVFGDHDTRARAMELLKEDVKRIRYLLAERVNMRRIPELSFSLDETLDHVERIERVLNKPDVKRAISTNDDQKKYPAENT